MPVGTPATWVNGPLTAATLNAEVRDQLRALFEITTPTEDTYTPVAGVWGLTGSWGGWYRTRGKRVSVYAAIVLTGAVAAWPASDKWNLTLPVAAGTHPYSSLTGYLTWGNSPFPVAVPAGSSTAYCSLAGKPGSLPPSGQTIWVSGTYETA